MFLLEDRGFPSGAILFGVGGDEHFTPHSTLVDPATGLEIAFVEGADSPDSEKARKTAKEHLQLRKRKGAAVPVYLTSLSSDDKTQVFALNDDAEWDPISRDEFPSFDALSAVRQKEQFAKSKSERIAVADELKGVGGAFAVFFIAVGFLSIFKIVEVKADALWLLGGAAVLAILPYYEVFEAKGISFKRRKLNKDGT